MKHLASIALLEVHADILENNIKCDELEGTVDDQTQLNRQNAADYRETTAILKALREL